MILAFSWNFGIKYYYLSAFLSVHVIDICMAEGDLFSIMLNEPLFWITLIVAIVCYVYYKTSQSKIKPEERPDFGLKYRKERIAKHLKLRDKAFGLKIKVFKAMLIRDVYPMGMIMSVENIPYVHKENNKPDKEIMLLRYTFRKFGLFNRMLAWLGFGKMQLVTEENAIEEHWDEKKKKVEIILPRTSHYRESAGVLILSRESCKSFIDSINSDMDVQNSLGFLSDFPRRLSNLHPAHAASTDTMELESDIEEKHKKSFMDRFRSGRT